MRRCAGLFIATKRCDFTGPCLGMQRASAHADVAALLAGLHARVVAAAKVLLGRACLGGALMRRIRAACRHAHAFSTCSALPGLLGVPLFSTA